MSRRIAIVGATGYTGRLAVQGLEPSASVILVGRDASRLAALGDYPLRTMDLTDRGACDSLAADVDVVVSFAGPFGLLGRPLLDACVDAGTDWVDVCGELEFVEKSLADVHLVARRTGSRVVHSCATESLPALCLVAELAEQVEEPVRAVDVAYRFELPLASPGTRLTARLDGLRPPRWYQDGRLVTPDELERKHPDGIARLTSYPEAALIPRVVACDRAAAWVVLRSWARSDGAVRTVDEILEDHRARLRPGPPEKLRKKTVVHVEVALETDQATHRASIAIHDSYAFSARAALAVAEVLDGVAAGLHPPSILGLERLTALLASVPDAGPRPPRELPARG